jgi:hypothetical protein
VVPADERLGPAHDRQAVVPLRLVRQPDFALAQAFVDARVERKLPGRLGQPLGREFLDEADVRLRIDGTGQRRIDPRRRILVRVAIQPEVNVGVQGMPANVERSGEQRAHSFEVRKLGFERLGFLDPREVARPAVVDDRRSRSQ